MHDGLDCGFLYLVSVGLVTESPNRGEMCILVVFVFILIVSLGGFLLGVFNVLGRDLFKCSL